MCVWLLLQSTRHAGEPRAMGRHMTEDVMEMMAVCFGKLVQAMNYLPEPLLLTLLMMEQKMFLLVEEMRN